MVINILNNRKVLIIGCARSQLSLYRRIYTSEPAHWVAVKQNFDFWLTATIRGLTPCTCYLNNVHFLCQILQKIKLEEEMTTVWQCLKNVVLPGYSSTRDKSTSRTKTKGAGGSVAKTEEVGLAIKDAIKQMASRGEVRKVIGTLKTCQLLSNIFNKGIALFLKLRCFFFLFLVSW